MSIAATGNLPPALRHAGGAVVPVITITSQPSSSTVATGAAASFTVAATVTLGATLSYQWQGRAPAGSYANLSNAGVYSTVTTTTLNISDATGLNGWQYRCVVSATGGAAPVASVGAVLTVTGGGGSGFWSGSFWTSNFWTANFWTS